MKIPTSIVIIVWIMFCVALPITVCVIRQRKIQKILTQIIFCLFLLALLVGVLCDIRITQSTTNIDFDFEGQWCNKIVFWGIKTTRVDKMINLIILIPLGEFVCLNSKYKNIKYGFLIALLVGVMTGCAIETLQFVLPTERVVQFSDAVFNAMSAMIGYLLFSGVYYVKLLVVKMLQRRKNCKLSNDVDKIS